MTEAGELMLASRFYGYQLIATDEVCSKLVRARRHKKKRIDKKWRKRYGYKRIPTRDVYIVGNTIYAHSKLIEALKQECQRRKED
jgi:hypothetical protein